ncbi:phosphatase PAP2 family protein [Ruegeria atlantica]|uniref:phosphatase PAP2 family protein n=1 Tax=Ruegeria atlantica TaxID=81569 RepID=UPI0020C513EC|nr:phosphatase PAP2 family protein [Ruegeria atlantica]
MSHINFGTISTGLTVAGHTLGSALWRNRLFLSIVLVHMFVGAVVSSLNGIPYWTLLLESLGTILLMILKFTGVFAAFFLGWRFFYAIFCAKPEKPIHWMISDTRKFLSKYVRVVDGTLCFVAIAVLANTFTCLKNMISILAPFSWDPMFAELDRMLHGGFDVWTLLWPAFGYPFVTTVINVAYHVWFVLIYVLTFVAAYDRREPERGMVYLVAFALTFIIGGNVLATLFSSVGPVYYQAFGFGGTYVEQLRNLEMLDQISPVWALDVHEILLNNFSTEGVVRGISAMPSMHVASSVLMALYAFRFSRWLGWIFTIFAVVIQIGSVHLAWHYAIDGYLGTLVALVCWYLAQFLTKIFYSGSARFQYASLAT